jgi:hypothetical protein
MKLLGILSFCLFACTVHALEIDDLLDQVDSTLTGTAFQDNLRARLSGTVDLEAYHFQQPAPGLIDSNADNLFNPRLTLFLDVQLGSQIYFFAQSRLDRGFDPSDHGARVRLDEYALRLTPWEDGRFTLQLGKFATVVGSHGICPGTTRLSTHHCRTKTSRRLVTRRHPLHRSISSAGFIARNMNSSQ